MNLAQLSYNPYTQLVVSCLPTVHNGHKVGSLLLNYILASTCALMFHACHHSYLSGCQAYTSGNVLEGMFQLVQVVKFLK